MLNSGNESACGLNDVRLIRNDGSESVFTTFSMALYRWPRVLPAFVCLAMCPSVAKSRGGNRPALVASK